MEDRPKLNIDTKGMKPVEAFMHGVLRPVLKQINNAVLNLAKHYLDSQDFQEGSVKIREEYVFNLCNSNQKFKRELVDLVLKKLTKEELVFYKTSSKELNKRIKTMAYERIQSQLPTLGGNI